MKLLGQANFLKILFLYGLILSLAENLYSQQWQSIMDSEHPRVEAMNAVVDNKIYIFSGFTEYTNETLIITSKSEVFDPALIGSINSPWKQLTDMPIPVTHVGAVTVGKTIWFSGGFAGNNPGTSTDIVQIYNTESDTWSQGPPLPEPLASNALVRLGNKLHSIGGLKPDRQTDTEVHYVLDLDNQESGWVKAADLPLPRNHLSAAAVGGKIYAIGGQFGHDLGWSDQRFLHEYDPITDTWTRKADLPLDRSHFEPGTITIDGKIIIVGGRNRNDNFILKNITEYDPIYNKWQELDPLPVRLLAPVSKIINNKLYVTHGGDTYKDPLNKAYVRDYLGSGTETLGFWPEKINSVAQNSNSLKQQVLIYTYNNEHKYDISTEDLPTWIKINNNFISNSTDPQGKYLEIELDPKGLTPGTYTYTISAKTPDNTQALLPVNFSVTDPNIIRINTGGSSVFFEGEIFEEDKYFSSGKSFINPKVTTIKNSVNAEIYLSERSAIPGETTFEYKIPVENGNYKIKMHFAEIYWGATGGGYGGTGSRIFNVNIENGPLELENFDIVKEAGSMTALIKEFEVEINDKILDIEFESSVDQPKISAIEIIPLYQDLNKIIFNKSTESVSTQKNIEATFTNSLLTSDQKTTKIYLSASDENGKVPDWLLIDNKIINNFETSAGKEELFSINSNRLLPGKYQASVVASAVNYSSSVFNIFVEILPGINGDPEIEISHHELIFSGIENSSTSSKEIIISNFGPTPLKVDTLIFQHNEGGHFKLNISEQVTIEIPAYRSSKVSVIFNPQTSGSLSSILQIRSNDPSQPLLEVNLYGLAAKGTEKLSEPALSEIIQTLGYQTDLGFTNLFSDPLIFPIGEEILAPLFRKAGIGKINFTPVARYSTPIPVSFGYYNITDKVTYSEIGKLSDTSDNHQTLHPDLKFGITEFNPGNKIFGLYAQNPNQIMHITDSLNVINLGIQHAARIYPIKDRQGNNLENQFLIAFEEDTIGDYQDYVFLISNVRPIYCQSDLIVTTKELIQPDCDNITGTVELEVLNANSKTEFKLGDRGTYQETPIFSGLDPGDYIIFIRETGAEDCETIFEFTINEPETDLDFTITINPVSCEKTSDGSASITNISGGTAPYVINWSINESENTELGGLYTGNYSVTVTDAIGCKLTKEFNVPKEGGCETYVIYREIFGNDTEFETDIEEYNWLAFSGLNASKVMNLPADPFRVAITPFKGSPLNNESINAGPSMEMARGFLTAHTGIEINSIIFTEEYPVDLKKFNINSISWFQGHNSNQIKTNLALRIEDQWYVSKQEFITTVNVNVDPEFNEKAQKKTFTFSLSGTEWYILDFKENTALARKTILAESEGENKNLPESVITAFGLYTVLEDQGSLRFDSFEIRAEGDSSVSTTLTDVEVNLGINNQAIISWKTSNEKNSDFFNIERSANNENFEQIGFVQGAGNSDTLLSYQFFDYSPIPGKSFYRIEYKDKEGNSKYSPSATLDFDPSNILDIKVFPNPISSNSFQVEITGLESNDIVFFKLLDNNGKLIITSSQSTDHIGHINRFFITGTILSPGLYTLTATSALRNFSKKILIQ